MPSPVYVRDAQERPLLPTSSAYARVLLDSGKAQRVPHPAVQLIQLTHPVIEPATAGVLLTAELHAEHADLLLVTERSGRSIVLHRFLLDLSLSSSLCRKPPSISAILRGVQLGLARLVPITHFIIHQSDDPTVKEQLAVHTGDLGSLVASLPALQNEAVFRPALATVWVSEASRAVDARNGASYVVRPPSPSIGAVARVALRGCTTTALITGLKGASCSIQVPVAASQNFITWEQAVIPIGALQRVWHPTEVALLPLAEVGRG